MFNSGKDLIRITSESKLPIYEVVIENEIKLKDKSKEEIRLLMEDRYEIMLKSSEACKDKELKSISGLIGGEAKKLYNYSQSNKTICGETINKAMCRAMSCSEVNAAMGRIVAAPTAGSCGILPGALITSAETLNLDKEQIINALFTASGIGQIIAKNATLSGAEGGCQAECGAAASMAAAGIVEMSGGTPKQALNAAAIALKNILGLVCDPVAGLVEVPCAKRNASGVVNAMLSADMALSGVESVIPFDEVVEAMYKVGRLLSQDLRETAMGGLAITPTALCLKSKIHEK